MIGWVAGSDMTLSEVLLHHRVVLSDGLGWAVEDDLSLGRADVTWRLEEYAATFGDDDIDFVGQIRQDGTFVPAPDGANPARSGNRNNIGDVWVVATHRDPAGEELTARAHLVVTIPLYMRFDPWPTSGDVRTPVGDDGP